MSAVRNAFECLRRSTYVPPERADEVKRVLSGLWLEGVDVGESWRLRVLRDLHRDEPGAVERILEGETFDVVVEELRHESRDEEGLGLLARPLPAGLALHDHPEPRFRESEGGEDREGGEGPSWQERLRGMDRPERPDTSRSRPGPETGRGPGEEDPGRGRGLRGFDDVDVSPVLLPMMWDGAPLVFALGIVGTFASLALFGGELPWQAIPLAVSALALGWGHARVTS